MSLPIHTLGRGCDFAPPSSSEQVRKPCDEMPPMRAQFFYCSPLPLDDSLTAGAPPTADSKNIKYPPRPFQKCDNKALLEAWLRMGSKRDRKSHNRTSRPKSGIEPTVDKKLVIGLKPKTRQEAKDFKESLKPTIANPETYQPTTGSTTHQQPTNSGTASYHQEHVVGGKGAKSALEMIGCPCKGSHLWCRKKTGTCTCASCPKASQNVGTETQTYQPHILHQQTKDKPTSAVPIINPKSKEDTQEDKPDQIKHSKHWEHNRRKGKSERGRSARESKLEEDPEPACSCNNPPEDSACEVGTFEEPQSGYSLPTEPLHPGKPKRGDCKGRQPDDLQPECSCTENEIQQDKDDQHKLSRQWEHNCTRVKSEREKVDRETKPEGNPKPECSCTEEELQNDEADQLKRSKHWSHNCKKGRSERKRSERDSKPAENIIIELPKDKNPSTRKSKTKGKAIATDDPNETNQIEKTEAWFDQQLKAQMEPSSASFCKNHRHKTEDNDESDDGHDDEDACCAEFDYKEEKHGIASLASRIPSCCDENKGDSSLQRQLSEVESIFLGRCEQSKDSSSLKRRESQAETIFSGSCDKSKGNSSSKRKDSEAETEFSGSCNKSKPDPSKETEANSISSCCDESKGNVSYQDQPEPESPTRFGSCCDPPKQDDGQILEKHALKTSSKGRSECCTELERCSGATVHEAFHSNNQSQYSSGQSAHKQMSNNNQLEHSAKSSARKTNSHPRHIQNSSGTPLHKSTFHDRQFGQSTKPLIQDSNPHRHQIQHSNGANRHLHKIKSNDNQFQHSGPAEIDACVEQKVATTSQKPRNKGRLFGRRQADGMADHEDELYSDSDEDLSADHTIHDQGDATNDKCICESHLQNSETSLPVARNGNAYTKSGQAAGSGTTGKPFLKLPARGENPAPQGDPTHGNEPAIDSQNSHERDSTEDMEVEGCKAYKHKDHTKCQVDVPVGTSRLHSVRLPCLVVQPIYWSPLNDRYPCIYGTWFYKETMCPVEPAVANQLEKGYRANECWSQTWDDQLNSAIEVGPEGEEKIVHRLWPNEKDSKASALDASEHMLSTDPYCAARCFYGEAAAEGKVEESDAKPTAATSISKKYPNSQVIYKNCEEAFILKPSLCPSAYYGRRPLTKIKNGACVGVAVVRGFDRKAWNKLHPCKKSTSIAKPQGKPPKHSNSDCGISDACPACKTQDEPEKVSDLCLVVHGIGQKLSERMDSFSFTLAVNSFRCEMKRELTNDDVRKVLREEFCGVTVLPVNWRANLSFEDGGPRKPGDKDRVGCDYSLNDITQPTIPRVRELISDVMLDIPYYMSGHKHKMIAALIAEANRIYRLWCKNNPGFHKNGRVHLLSHSLGSVMALEVLSKQPTALPAELSWRPNTKHFEFRTTNCFLAGSPCAFFLLLENKALVPRKGIFKAGCECENGSGKEVFGDAGTFGCLAVDNIYNIIHCNDPIAYRLNACVDSRYSACLKPAEVPDSSRSFMTAVAYAMKSAAGMSQNEEISVGEMPRPAAITKMPSQMEMEVHDFTAEEMAEKKFCQLNENGQVDWILGNRQGMLANQYIDMLSAHSSYWNSKDFTRFLCVEIGRRPGKMNTLPNMRARKKSQM
ncbi:hypothetical protein EYC84_009670 [Monilinia fructicola]|uniref:DDHD domain-containing protein n=3 Tax=Monilinia fructicola TaxID=38448 RepID=A0A5M9JBV8_MONFR|nr:hypothetical protein EYC84_009670 [Monilinia fructicola]